MRAQHIGCTIYFHSSKRYSTIHLAPTSSWNVPSFCGLNQPIIGRPGMRGNIAGIAESPGMDAASGTLGVMPCATFPDVGMT